VIAAPPLPSGAIIPVILPGSRFAISIKVAISQQSPIPPCCTSSGFGPPSMKSDSSADSSTIGPVGSPRISSIVLKPAGGGDDASRDAASTS
jgi:hypothetical protein